MARHKRLIAGSNVSVREIELIAPRGLKTFDAKHRIWQGGGKIPSLDGFIVRLDPPAGIEDAAMSMAKKRCLELGAAKVFTLPRPRSATVTAAVLEDRVKFRSMAPRAAVLQIAEESNSVDRPGLLLVLERVMGEVGL